MNVVAADDLFGNDGTRERGVMSARVVVCIQNLMVAYAERDAELDV